MPVLGCGSSGLNKDGQHWSKGSGTIRMCGLVGVGMALLEEVHFVSQEFLHVLMIILFFSSKQEEGFPGLL